MPHDEAAAAGGGRQPGHTQRRWPQLRPQRGVLLVRERTLTGSRVPGVRSQAPSASAACPCHSALVGHKGNSKQTKPFCAESALAIDCLSELWSTHVQCSAHRLHRSDHRLSITTDVRDSAHSAISVLESIKCGADLFGFSHHSWIPLSDGATCCAVVPIRAL